MRRSLVALTVAALVLAACGDDDAASDPIALDERDDGATDATDGDGDAADGADGGADGGAVDGAAGGGEDGVATAGTAAPGTWPVGEAGTVTFSLASGRLALDEVAPADGWEVTEEDSDDDEIEVELRRGQETYEFHVELEDGTTLEVSIDHDLDDADPGTFELGEAGSVTVSVDGSQLVLDDLSVADGWEVATQTVDGDELEIDLVGDQQRWELDVELDDGRLEVRRDHRVRGPVPA